MYVAGLHETISGSTGSAVVHNDANLPAISVWDVGCCCCCCYEPSNLLSTFLIAETGRLTPAIRHH